MKHTDEELREMMLKTDIELSRLTEKMLSMNAPATLMHNILGTNLINDVGDNYYLPELTVGEIKVVSIKCTRNTKASLERKQKDGFLFETYNKARLYAMALKELNGKLRKLTY